MTDTAPEAILAALVALPSLPGQPNAAIADWIMGQLAAMGVPVHRLPGPEGDRVNLFASIGPADQPGFVLSGHMDVVPATGQAWTSDPFRLTARDGRLYGRGATDMKGFLACMIAAVPLLQRATLRRPVHLAFSYDEEIGCVGVRRLLDLLKDAPVKPRLCIVGEPTLMQAVTAHKGKLGFRVTAHGLEAHSSLAPIGVNAIYMAADLIAAIRAIQQDIAANGISDGDYEVAYTTLHVGKMQGGEVMNIVPNRCTFDFEIRYLPEDDENAIVARIEAAAEKIAEGYRGVFADARFTFQDLQSYPAMNTPVDSEAVKFVHALTGGNSTGKITFGTEGGLFQKALGTPAVVCGPGNIAVAHKPDEHVSEAQMAQCDRMLERLVEKLSA